MLELTDMQKLGELRKSFELWASTKDFYNTNIPYPYDCYVRSEMQIAWIAWRDSHKFYYGEL